MGFNLEKPRIISIYPTCTSVGPQMQKIRVFAPRPILLPLLGKEHESNGTRIRAYSVMASYQDGFRMIPAKTNSI